MGDYRWSRITPLTDSDRAIDLGAIRPLYETWRASKERLQESSREQLAEFNRRLVRRLSVETGILERLYDLDRGTTEALVAHGFVEELVSHASTNIEPSRLIDILRDQEAAIQLVVDCLSKQRELTKGLIQDLHGILTRHQETTTAVDQFGNRHEIPLLKGRFKEQPNNPRRPDGSLHEYCPPMHVDSEIENLLGWLSKYSDEDPIVVAAWFHHRFTQIHPYQDGNGRVARALTTMLLLRHDLLPLVIDRDVRVEYIGALEAADAGGLSRLALMFARLEKAAILQALSVDADAEIARQETLTAAVIESLAETLSRRRLRKESELRQVNKVALTLRLRTKDVVENALRELEDKLKDMVRMTYRVDEMGTDRDNSHWYRFEVVQSAKEAGKFVNFSENHYFAKASVRTETERLAFVVSFHHVGRELTGIMEATAFAKLDPLATPEDGESGAEQFFMCSLEPFVFTHNTNPADIAASFESWLDRAFAVAIKEYGDRL